MKPLAGRKLAFLSSSTGWGGLEQNLLRHARWMQALGADVTLCTVPDSPLHRAAASVAPEREGGPWAVLTFARQPRYFPYLAAQRLARRLRGVHVIWARDPRDLAFAGLTARKLDAAFLFQQGMQITRKKRSLVHRVRFRRVTWWVTPLESLRQEALANTVLRTDQTRLIPLSLDPRWFAPALPRSEARLALGLPEDGLFVGIFGRVDPLKGQDVFLRALAEAPGWRGLIVGSPTVNASGQYLESLHALSRELGIEDRVHWLPHRDDLRPAYACLDAFALCSNSETFGMVTLEALASGCWVLGTDSGGTPEILREQPGTALFAPGDAAGLARHLVEIAAQAPRIAGAPVPDRWLRPGMVRFQSPTVASLWVDLLNSKTA
jgi:D-inositol-3-phosphate glycosyltransferase